MLIKGAFTKSWLEQEIFWDECSSARHFFAKLKLCKHKGEWLSMKQYFHKMYDGRVDIFESPFIEYKDD